MSWGRVQIEVSKVLQHGTQCLPVASYGARSILVKISVVGSDGSGSLIDSTAANSLVRVRVVIQL